MKARHFPFVRSVLGLCLCALAGSALSQAHSGESDPVPRREELWMAVSSHTLDQMRGGFDPGNGLLVSFGITRAVYINGNLVTQTTLDFGHINNLTPAQAAQLDKQLSSLNLVQNGPGNTVAAQQGGANYGTVIQNTLDNQHIVNQTVINATSNAAGMLKNYNIQSSVSDAVARAIMSSR
ncbi:hypothetical protein QTI24_06715 [Variovorax sp. J22P240]|uniref:hypothetical protein n=1 Tax=unclassified Variovorax TaxID=663243 RepID=UPI00257508AE|nr:MULTISPECIES: hypothetical protein [unclassified Variovorax]MDL9998285.1 hypothetical protein [Variovorax sp. J22P240]MDM0048585.1 hypothetical protein [Variovorax sp. J22R115]